MTLTNMYNNFLPKVPVKIVFMQFSFIFFCANSIAQSDNPSPEYFKGQSEFIECQEQIEVEYSTKKMEEFVKSVENLKDKELVYINVLKKGQPTYMFCYYGFMDVHGNPYPVLIKTKDFENKYFPKGDAVVAEDKKNRYFFYDADCFREIVEENPALLDNLELIE